MTPYYAFKIKSLDNKSYKFPYIMHTGERIIIGLGIPVLPNPDTPEKLAELYVEFIRHDKITHTISYEPPFELIYLSGVFKVDKLSRKEIKQFEDSVKKALSGK